MKENTENIQRIEIFSRCLCPWRWLIGVALVSALVAFIDSEIGWQKLAIQWQLVSIKNIAIAYSLFIGSHLLRALRIHTLLKTDYPTEFMGVAKISALHQMANNLLPMRIGEFMLPSLFNRYYQMPWAQGLSRLVWLRLFDLIIMGLVVALVLCFQYSLIIVSSVTLVTAVALCFLPFKERIAQLKAIKTLTLSLRNTAPKSGATWRFLLATTLAAWSCKLLAISFVIVGFSDTTTLTAISAALGAEISSLLPIHGVAGAGTFEASFIGGARLFDQSSTALLAAAVNVHLFILASTCSLAFLLSPMPLPRHTLAEAY